MSDRYSSITRSLVLNLKLFLSQVFLLDFFFLVYCFFFECNTSELTPPHIVVYICGYGERVSLDVSLLIDIPQRHLRCSAHQILAVTVWVICHDSLSGRRNIIQAGRTSRTWNMFLSKTREKWDIMRRRRLKHSCGLPKRVTWDMNVSM